ncbi:MAG TPA: FAD-binding oxidoreductase [Steroidobacteraceae bacterium]|nr:FAD-binding oxidoreductase [Steroidobacteraceae bacterium]
MTQPAASSQAVARLTTLLGADSVHTDAGELGPLLVDHRGLYHGTAAALILPRSVEQVAATLAFCNDNHIGVVPQGGNTSYCGGATPDASGSQVIVSLSRLNRVREVDARNFSLTAEAGCVLARVQRAAADAELLFPLSLGSEGSCQIGGNLATNAGGTSVLRYGMMRDLVLGLEVVLADGRVLNALSGLRKDNTGYDVKSLFLGAEGTLGIITAATLKLFPAVRSVATAFVAVSTVESAVELLGRLRAHSGECVSSFELIPRLAVDLCLQHIRATADPLPGRHDWYVLCELTSPRAEEPLDTILEEVLAEAHGSGLVRDAAIAQSGREAAGFWSLRHEIPRAQRLDGASLKHDISVPVGALPRFVERAAAWVSEHVPEGRLVAYGHVGDGNLHFNLNQDPLVPEQAFLARAAEVQRAIHDLVHDFGGSFSAEHGIGQLKVAELERYASPVELDLMRTIKKALDPNGIMNPGKVLKAGRESA